MKRRLERAQAETAQQGGAVRHHGAVLRQICAQDGEEANAAVGEDARAQALAMRGRRPLRGGQHEGAEAHPHQAHAVGIGPGLGPGPAHDPGKLARHGERRGARGGELRRQKAASPMVPAQRVLVGDDGVAAEVGQMLKSLPAGPQTADQDHRGQKLRARISGQADRDPHRALGCRIEDHLPAEAALAATAAGVWQDGGSRDVGQRPFDQTVRVALTVEQQPADEQADSDGGHRNGAEQKLRDAAREMPAAARLAGHRDPAGHPGTTPRTP